MSLARRNLLKDKTCMDLSVGGVAVAVMLILLLKRTCLEGIIAKG